MIMRNVAVVASATPWVVRSGVNVYLFQSTGRASPLIISNRTNGSHDYDEHCRERINTRNEASMFLEINPFEFLSHDGIESTEWLISS